VVEREFRDQKCMLRPDGEFLEAARTDVVYEFKQVSLDFAETKLDGKLPNGSGRDEDFLGSFNVVQGFWR
jgi:hypothetical protein